MNHDGGEFSGQRKIRGGRHWVRSQLYIATVVAIRFNQTMKTYYERKTADGMKPKMALVAVMRKMLVTLNNMLKTAELWRDQAA